VPATATSSLEAFHAIEALVTVEPVTTTPVGVLGAVLSARVLVVTVFDLALSLPAPSTALTV